MIAFPPPQSTNIRNIQVTSEGEGFEPWWLDSDSNV